MLVLVNDQGQCPELDLHQALAHGVQGCLGAVEDAIAIPGEPRPMWRVEVFLPDRVPQRLELRLDVADERQVGGLAPAAGTKSGPAPSGGLAPWR